MNPNSKTNHGPTPQQIAQYCRKAIAIWLREFAQKIETGQVDAFDLKWSHDSGMVRPVGAVMSDPSYMPATLPDRQWEAQQEPQPTPATNPAQRVKLSEIRGSILVEDMTSNLQNLKPCNDPECPNCKNKG